MKTSLSNLLDKQMVPLESAPTRVQSKKNNVEELISI